MSDIDPRESLNKTATFGAIGVDPDTAKFARADLGTSDLAAVAALPPRSALLIVQRGPNLGARFLLDAARTTVGRHPNADIFLDDVTVSRKHAEFLLTGEGYDVRDVGSLNGTYVNRERVDSKALQAGDEVQIGKYRLTYHPSPHREQAGEEQ